MSPGVSFRAPEGEDLPEEHVGEAPGARPGEEPREDDFIRRCRAAALYEPTEREQITPRFADVALPRTGGLDAAEEREHVLDYARRAPSYLSYWLTGLVIVL
jgi:hypothetical protein